MKSYIFCIKRKKLLKKYITTQLIQYIYIAKQSGKNVALSNLSIHFTWKNIKKSYKNNKFKISAPTWIDKFGLYAGSYSISDIQGYFE